VKTSTTRINKKLRAPPAGEPWMWQLPRLMESFAWRCMTGADHKVLDRLTIEHSAHASLCNGALKCTYNDFEKYGVRRASIRESINRLCALGLIKRTRVGRRGYGEAKGEAAEYELTFYATRTENNNVSIRSPRRRAAGVAEAPLGRAPWRI
jgi:hypothetical protein